MMRIALAIIFTFVLSFRLMADDCTVGDVIEKDGISYKILVTYLVVDKKESPDAIEGPDKFYCSGEAMVIHVDKKLRDVVIPPTINRFKVVGLTDSLFYKHKHDRIWLPELQFMGSGCFAKLKVGSGALVVHNVANLGVGVFDGLDAELIFDITRKINLGKAFFKNHKDSAHVQCGPKGVVKIRTDMLRYIKPCWVYDECYSATSDNYKKWIRKAFNGDEAFMKNALNDRGYSLGMRSYSTTPSKAKDGLLIIASAENVKGLGFPWGSLTRDYYRQSKYTVVNKKKRRKVTCYRDFIPVVDATQRSGWYVRFLGKEGEERFSLNGKLLKK